ncbi:MAG: carboxylesterase family protein, partial [Desulfobacterales bacterium]|nr:carboxylesterase family protein [Desulfobacterales bacterium]
NPTDTGAQIGDNVLQDLADAEPEPYPSKEPIATLFNPVFETNRALPFPSDMFAKADPSTNTGIKVEMVNALVNPNFLLLPSGFHPETIYVDADGFSAGTAILFELDGPIDPNTLPADGGETVVVIDYGTGNQVPLDVAMSILAQDHRRITQDHLVQAIPRGRLEYEHRYIAYVTKALKRENGDSFSCSEGFEKAKSKDEADKVSKFYKPHLEFLEQMGVELDNLLSATVFTVRSLENATKPMLNLVRTAYNQDHEVEIISDKKSLNPLSSIEATITGKVKITNFRTPENEMNLESGNEGTQEWTDFVLYIPKSAKDVPAPVCIYGHGFTVFKETAVVWAENNAKVGVATIAIDKLGHGSRVDKDGWNATQGVLKGEPNFGDGLRILALFMHSPLDHIALLKALQTSPVFKELDIVGASPLDLPKGDGLPDLDTSSIVYQGTSLGALCGTTFSAIAPGLKGSYVHVGGSSMTKFVAYNEFFIEFISEKIPEGLTGADYALLWGAAQQVMDYFDSLNYLQNFKQGMVIPATEDEDKVVISPHPHAMVYSLDDGLVPPIGAVTMAEVVGMPQLPPVLEGFDFLDQSNDFQDGFGLLQVDVVNRDLSFLEDIIDMDMAGLLEHAIAGMQSQALESQQEWLKQVLATEAASFCNNTVQTNEGPVVGQVEDVDPAGCYTCSYKGIPYAAPPVDDLRWKAPQPAPQQEGIHYAKEYGSDCMQNPGDESKMCEDCLYLNIWRPAKQGTYPVMVWIHGGALLVGSGSTDMYNGNRIAGREDVVVVTINYRLGALGYLSIPEFAEEDPYGSAGNYGLLDQIEALKWVKNNIAQFGGDPENITIFGESAGGWSVCNIMASPFADGLFQKAIIESGACNATLTASEGYEIGQQFAESLGCIGDGTSVAQCLRTKTSEEVLEATGGILQILQGFSFLAKEDGVVLPDTPINVLRQEDSNPVPLLAGTNLREERLFGGFLPLGLIPAFISDNIVFSLLGEDFFIDEAKAYYDSENYINDLDMETAIVLDVGLTCPVYEAVKAVSQKHPENTFYYRFDYDDHILGQRVGTGHAFEIPLVFGTPDAFLYTENDCIKAEPMIDAMMSFWANFAKNGFPEGPNTPYWPAFTMETPNKMILDFPLYVEQDANEDKCNCLGRATIY